MKYEFGHIWFGLKTNGEKNHKIITGYSFQKTKMITKCPTKSFALENEFWNNREHQKKHVVVSKFMRHIDRELVCFMVQNGIWRVFGYQHVGTINE